VPEILEGPRGADGEGVEGVFVPDEEDQALLEDSTSHVERELLEEDEVDVASREVLEALMGPGQTRPRPGVGRTCSPGCSTPWGRR